MDSHAAADTSRVRRRAEAGDSKAAATTAVAEEVQPQAQRRKTQHPAAAAAASGRVVIDLSAGDPAHSSASAPAPAAASTAATSSSAPPAAAAAAASSSPSLAELESASESALAAQVDALARDFGPHIDGEGYYRSFDVSDPRWHDHFRQAGFVVLRDIGAVAQDECWSQLWDYLEQYCHKLDRNDMSTWDSAYFTVPDSNGKQTTLRSWPKGGKAQGFVNLFHAPFMWQHRQSPSIVRAFHELWCALSPEYSNAHAAANSAAGSAFSAAAAAGSAFSAAAAAAAPSAAPSPSSDSAFIDPGSGLFCSIDRLGVMPPKRVFGTDTTFLHWDQCAKSTPTFRGLQGVLNLRDNVPATVRQRSQSEELSSCVGSSSGESGGFWCVPASHAYFPRFGERFPQNCTGQFSNVPSKPKLHWLYRHLYKVTMRAGSMVIWDSGLAHGNYPNCSADRTRFVQYLTYAPATWREQQLLQIRRESIRCGGQYSHRRALLVSFSAVTHGLGTSQDVSKRRKKIEQLRLMPEAERTAEQEKLLQDLESELLLIGNADGAALLPKAAFDSAAAFSNRKDYYAPQKRVQQQGDNQQLTVPYFDTAPLLTDLGKHIAGLQQLAAFTP